MEENYINIGKIEVALFSKISTDIITDEVILTNERFFISSVDIKMTLNCILI